MDLKVNDTFEIPDGLHEGVIIDVQYREKPYEYTDVVIEIVIDGKEVTMKAGYATYISETSKLGKLLYDFGAILDVGKQLNPNKILVGKKCVFQL